MTDDHRDDRRHPPWFHDHLRLDDLGIHRHRHWDRRDHPCCHLGHRDDRRSRHRRHQDDRRHRGQPDRDPGSRRDLEDADLGHRDHLGGRDRRDLKDADPGPRVADLGLRGCLVAPDASPASCRDLVGVRQGQAELPGLPGDPCRSNHRRGCYPDEEPPVDPCRSNHRRGCCPDEVRSVEEHRGAGHLDGEHPGAAALGQSPLMRQRRQVPQAQVPREPGQQAPALVQLQRVPRVPRVPEIPRQRG